MNKLNLPFAAALALSAMTVLGQSPASPPQNAPQSPASPPSAAANAKPTPYEGVSQPPADDVINATEEAPAQPPAPAPSSTASPVPAAPASAARHATPSAAAEDGIVETPVSDEEMNASPAPKATSAAPGLQARGAGNPDEDIVTEVSYPENELPEGTPIHARIHQELSSRESSVGTPWTADVSQDVTTRGRVIIPAGSIIHGRVSHADYGRRFSGPASLRLTPEDVVLPDGTRYMLHAVVSQTSPGSNTKVKGEEGTIEPKDHPKRVAAEYALGGGGGAVLGAELGGPAGAVAGSAVGLGVVTAHWLLTDQAAILPAHTAVTFGLTQPLLLTPATAQSTTAQASR